LGLAGGISAAMKARWAKVKKATKKAAVNKVNTKSELQPIGTHEKEVSFVVATVDRCNCQVLPVSRFISNINLARLPDRNNS
jgi:hypothetical protein